MTAGERKRVVRGLGVIVLETEVGLAVSAVLVPRTLATSRGLANLLAVASALLVAAGWIVGGVASRRGARWRGALVGLIAYLVAGSAWTAGSILLDPWQVDYGRVDIVRFVLYSVLLWPFALTYTLDWFGLGGF
ncbi:hypothetical protein [Thermomicrobium sp.]